MPPPPAHADLRPMAMTEPSSTSRRIIGLLLAAVCLALLVTAAGLEPSPDGLGTHRQIVGMQPCGWIILGDTPCPTCGMTTAFAHAANGNLVASLMTQPMGAFLALLAAMVFLVGSYTAVTGSRIASALRPLWTRWTLWGTVTFAIVAWGWKILNYKGLL